MADFRQPRRRERNWSIDLIVLFALLILPALAILKLAATFDPRWVLGYAVAISLIAYCMNWRDKRLAQAGKWRIPEKSLHWIEFLGGWPGAFLAHRIFRHKISKRPYQIGLWVIIVLHELLFSEFLFDWRIMSLVLPE